MQRAVKWPHEAACPAQARGLTALRFNWAYVTAQGKHAPDLSVELKDLEAALA